MNIKLATINYKNELSISYLGGGERKHPLETHCFPHGHHPTTRKSLARRF